MSSHLPVWLKEDSGQSNAYVLALYCQPGAKKTEVQGEHDGRLKIRLAAPPVEGKANEALVFWISKQLHISRTSVELLAGDLSRLKRVRVSGVSSEIIQETFHSAN